MLLRRRQRKPQPFKRRKRRLSKMSKKLRSLRKKKKRLRLRPKLPLLWQSQRKVRPAMPMRMMQGTRPQATLRSRTARPALRLQGAKRIRRTRKRISDIVFESTQHSKREGRAPT